MAGYLPAYPTTVPFVPTVLCYSPRTDSYDGATFSPVTTSDEPNIIIYMQADSAAGTNDYYLGGSVTGAYLYHRGSDGRTRIRDDSGNIRTANLPALSNGLPHKLEIRAFNPSGGTVEYWVDDVLEKSLNGMLNECTFDRLGISGSGVDNNDGAIWGINIDNIVAWNMQSESDTEFDGVDIIGSNDLIYTNPPNPILPINTQVTPCLT